jgi:hypothetical protein
LLLSQFLYEKISEVYLELQNEYLKI